MSKISRRKISIRTRILVMVLSLIAVIFLVIFTVFNLLVREYIKGSINEQLKDVMQIVRYNEKGSQTTQRRVFIPDMRRLPRGPVGKAETIIVSENYELVFPDLNMIIIQHYDEIFELVKQLKTEQVELQSTEIMRLKASGREYFFVSVQIPEYLLPGNLFLIYFIDMTAITSFAERINVVLLAVMGIAGILAVVLVVFLSGKIAEPVRELTRFAVRIGEGDFSRSALKYGDIELAELAESMNKAAAQLDAYDKEQKTFFQNVSHELRTPLQSIRCNAEGIEHGILDQNQSSRVIISESDRLSELVEDLLYLSRIDSITPDSQFIECDLRELLSNSAERQSSLAAKRDLQFVFDFDDQPVNMNCDEKRLSRAFSNLISNAIRYAKRTITLSCRRENGVITIFVLDDGEGIAEEDLPHIFDRFYKGHGGKHGIGLSIVKSVIEQHNGKIEARNSAGGAAFKITF